MRKKILIIILLFALAVLAGYGIARVRKMNDTNKEVTSSYDSHDSYDGELSKAELIE